MQDALNIGRLRRSLRSLGPATLATAQLLSPLGAAAAETDGRLNAAGDETRPAPNGEPTVQQAEAQAQYEQGVQAYRAQRYQQAIDLFLSADALAPRPALAFNVARAYEKRAEPARALQYYREYLRRGADPSNARDVEKRVRELQAALAERGVQQVTVRSVPGGATLTVDGQGRGVTPWTGELPLGTHQVHAEHAQYQPRSVTLTVDGKQAQDVELTLPAATEAGGAPAGAHGTVGPRSDLAAATEEQPQPAGLQPWPWIVLGAGGASLAAAGVFELLRRDAESDAHSARYQAAYHDDRERMGSHQTTARVLLGVSAALLVSGGVLALIDGAAYNPEQAPVALGCDATTCLGTWMGNF